MTMIIRSILLSIVWLTMTCLSSSLTIGTFNLALGGTKYTLHGKERYFTEKWYWHRTAWSNLYDMASVIDQYNIDIIGLQELDVNTGRIKQETSSNSYIDSSIDIKIDDPSQIVKVLNTLFNKNYMARFINIHDNPYGDGGAYGNSVIFNIDPFTNAADTSKVKRYLFTSQGSERRGAIAKKFIFHDDNNKYYSLWYVTTHFDDDLAIQKNQLDELLNIVDSYSYPTIICGDFNMNYHDSEMQTYLNAKFASFGIQNIMKTDGSGTFPRAGTSKLDYCLFDAKTKPHWFTIHNIQYIQPKNKNGEWFTDHWGIIFSLEFGN